MSKFFLVLFIFYPYFVGLADSPDIPTPIPMPRIIDGVEAEPGAWPSTTAMLRVEKLDEGNFDAQYCGGSLIAADWVLTAAHCVDASLGTPHRPEDLQVLVGSQDLRSGGERISVSRIIRYPHFDVDSIDNDLALVKLAETVSYQSLPVLPGEAPLGSDPGNANAIVTGWGDTNAKNSSHDRPEKLKQLNVPVIAQNRCKDAYDSTLLPDFLEIDITANMMCAGFRAEGKDSCFGDSGGPLMVLNPDNSGEYTQIGIVSFGQGCGTEDAYGVYTRLSRFNGWIDDVTQGVIPLTDIPHIISGDSQHEVSSFSRPNSVVVKLNAEDNDSIDLDWDLIGDDLGPFRINDSGEIKISGPLIPGENYELYVRVSDKEDGMDMAVIKIKSRLTGSGSTGPFWLVLLLLVFIVKQFSNNPKKNRNIFQVTAVPLTIIRHTGLDPVSSKSLRRLDSGSAKKRCPE